MTDSPPVAPKAPPVTPATPPVTPAPSKPTLLGDDAPPAQDPPKADTPPKEVDPPKADEPLTYEAFTVPEGFSLEGEKLDNFTKLAAEMKLDQAAAQRLIDYYIGEQTGMQKQIQEHEAHLVNTWKQEVAALPEAKQLVQDARTAFARFATTPGSKELLTSWVGEHPEMVQLLARIGAHFRNGSMAQDNPGSASTSEKGTAEDLYPSMKPKKQ